MDWGRDKIGTEWLVTLHEKDWYKKIYTVYKIADGLISMSLLIKLIWCGSNHKIKCN